MTKQTKLYYTCPIQALYMMKEFGVKFECHGWNSGYGIDRREEKIYLREIQELIQDLKDGGIKDCGPLYVTPESESIFEPQDGDVVGWLEKTNYYGWVDSYGDIETAGDRVIGAIDRKEQNWVTIMRAGKLFFQPKTETL